jgi:hypothetical protein
MVAERLDFCFDRYADPEGFDPNALPDPVDLRRASHEELAMAWRKNWAPGQELRIRFLDGDADLHERVQVIARKWLEYANLVFNFGNHAEAELRITFRGNGYSSSVGTDATTIPQDQDTMMLGGLSTETPQEEFRRPVLHEFGHAIGCIHEQAQPAAEIPWDTAAVYRFFRRWQGWDDQTIHHNVLRRYTAAEARFSEYDPDSIMQYPVPEELTIGDFSIGWNTDLSEQDKSFIRRMYPP